MFRRLLAAGFAVVAVSALPACSASSQGPDTAGAPTQMSDDSPARPHEPRVLVFPFAPTGDAGAYQWIGRGIQQSLQADLSRSGTAQVIFPATQPAANTPVNPIEIARSSNANVLVVGSYQVAGDQVRVTGTVYDVGTVRDLGGLKATGAATDIFKVEDELNDQLKAVLPTGYTETSSKPLPAVQYGSNVASSATTTPQATVTASANVSSTPASSAPDVTYNYINVPSSTLAYDSPYYYPGDYYAGGFYGGYPYFYDGPFVGFVGIYGRGFYGYRGGYGYGYGYGFGRPYYGGYYGHGFGVRPGFVGGFGGFHGGGFGGFHGGGFGGGFHGGGFGGGHR